MMRLPVANRAEWGPVHEDRVCFQERDVFETKQCITKGAEIIVMEKVGTIRYNI